MVWSVAAIARPGRLRWIQPESDSAVGADVVPDGNLVRHGHADGESRRSQRAAGDLGPDSVDLRGRATDQPAVVPNDRAVRSRVAHRDNDRYNRADTW